MKRIVSTDLYTRVTLAIIAGCLVLSCLRDADINWAGYVRAKLGFDLPEAFRPSAIPVRLVSLGPTGGRYDKMLPRRGIPVYVTDMWLDVDVTDTVDVRVINTVDVEVQNDPLVIEPY